MTVEECTKLMINALKEGHLSTANIVDKHCEWASSESFLVSKISGHGFS